MFYSAPMQSLLQRLNSAIVAQEQPHAMQHMGMAVFQLNFIFKSK